MFDTYYSVGDTGVLPLNNLAYVVMGCVAGDYNMWQYIDSTGAYMCGYDFTSDSYQYLNVTFGSGSFTVQTAGNFKFLPSKVYRYVAW
jgi:hypothetical protein